MIEGEVLVRTQGTSNIIAARASHVGTAPNSEERPFMSRIFGFVVCVAWLGLAFGAFTRATAGWSAGHTDIGFWWTVIGSLLAIAGLGAGVGTFLHTRSSEAH